MTNKELVAVAAKLSGKGISQKVVQEVLTNAFKAISDGIKSGSDKVTIAGFGILKVTDVPARKGKCNGKVWSKSAGKKVTFGLASAIKKSIS